MWTRLIPGPCGRRPSATWSAAGRTTSTNSRAVSGTCPSGGSSPSRCRNPIRPSGGPRPARTAIVRSVSSASVCARSPSASPRPRSRPRSTSTGRPWPAAREPLGAFVNNHAATFTMALCAPDRQQAMDVGPPVLRVVPGQGGPPDRHPDRLDGRAPAGPGQLFLRRRPQEDRGRRPARPDQPRVPDGHARLRPRARPTSASKPAGSTRKQASTCFYAW